MLTALQNVTVAVHDLEAGVKDYTRLLGRAPSARTESRDLETRSALFKLSNTSLELATPLPAEPAPQSVAFAAALRAHLESEGPGLVQLAFGTDDVAACVGFLRGQGLPLPDPQPGQSSDGALRWRGATVPPSASRGIQMRVLEDESEASLPLAAATADRESAVNGLDHVVIRTDDIDATGRVYEGLGLRLALDRSFEARGLRMLFFRIAGVTVEVVGRLDAEEKRASQAVRDRFGGLAWQVQDLARIRARLLDAGCDVSEARPGHKPGTRVCTVRSDTQGVPTLLIGPDLG